MLVHSSMLSQSSLEVVIYAGYVDKMLHGRIFGVSRGRYFLPKYKLISRIYANLCVVVVLLMDDIPKQMKLSKVVKEGEENAC